MRTKWTGLLCALLLLTCNTASVRADEILVSAAASLTDALNALGKAYTRANPQTTVRYNFGASGALQQQIAQGAPVDVFASAGLKEMDALQQQGRIDFATRIDFAGNRLVLIAPKASKLKNWNDLLSPAMRHLALSNPASVPSGRYAQETLQHRGLWSQVQAKAVFGENVRQTLAYVANGDADAGLVFATDARIEGTRVRVVQEAIPGTDHVPILYPAAVVVDGPNPPAARRFVQFLHSPSARKILTQFGFSTSFAPVPAPHKIQSERR